MPDRTQKLSKLPIMALKDIPKPNADAKRITALVKEGSRTTGYQLSDGRLMNKDEAVRL